MSSGAARVAASARCRLAQCYYTLLACVYLLWRWARTAGAALRPVHRQMPRKLLEKYNHKYMRLPSGVTMHYVEAGDPASPLMVMIHGFPEFWYSWRFQIDHFQKRYRVVAIDQRGYGNSSKPAAVADYSTALLAKDVDDLIHGLRYDWAVVVGHDVGGAVAWRLALAFPATVRRLVVCSSPHPAVEASLMLTSAAQRARSWYVFLFQTGSIPEAAIASDDFKLLECALWGEGGLRNRENLTIEDMEAWKFTFGRPDCLRSAINYYRCAVQQQPDDAGEDGKCHVPTLILWGDADKFHVKEGATLSAQLCDDVQLFILPDASHWIQQDEPRLVNDHIDDFLHWPQSKSDL